jgi:Ni2+-binding GTPase involved in maturation of urease and hydrogenase
MSNNCIFPATYFLKPVENLSGYHEDTQCLMTENTGFLTFTRSKFEVYYDIVFVYLPDKELHESPERFVGL